MYQNNIEKAFLEADTEIDGKLTIDEVHAVLLKADEKLRAYPATAQLATQQGVYVANLLNEIADGNSSHSQKPFHFKFRGSLAYVGGDAAVIDFTGSKSFMDKYNLKPLSGRGTYYL